jgi:predicted ATPase
MITRFGFKNFKAWESFGPVRFAPLTVLFGSNSSGKSSMAQFLLMLKQTAESPDRKMVFNIGNAKTAVDLGSFQEMVFEHDETRKIGVDMQWSLPKRLKLTDNYAQTEYTGESVRFEAEVGLDAKRATLAVERMNYTFGDLKAEGFAAGMKRSDKPKTPFELSQKNYDFVRNMGRKWPITGPVKCYGFPDEVVNYYQNADVVRSLNLGFEQLFQNTFYLGPLRERFLRQYSWTGEVPEHVGWKGELAIPAILAAKGRSINRGKGSRLKPFAEVIASWLQQLGLIEAFEVNPVAPKRREYEVLVKTPGARKMVNITDVGFGISQFLPVLAQCYYAPPGSVILIEQPEIHLHPSAQAWLADLFIDVIRSWERGHAKNVQLIIESHSEHFLRRLQRRIAEQRFAREEVAAYFFKPGQHGASLEELDVDIFGNIRNWPEKFFGDTMEDAVAMTDAQMERIRQGEKPNE